MKSKYYAVLTSNLVAIFTSWEYTSKAVIGIKNVRHKSFPSYDEAKCFIMSELSHMDAIDFGLDRCPLYLNKKFVRRNEFIEARKSTIKEVPPSGGKNV